MQDILVVESVDVRRADDPDDSKVLTITKMGLAEMARKAVEHTPGGGVGSVNFLMPMADAFEPKFSVKGLDLDVVRKFGFAAGQFDKWTFAGTVRNKRTNKLLPLRATYRGIVSNWSPGEHTPGELLDCDHTLKEVTYADLVVDDVELFAWDFYARIWRQNGVDVFAETRTALGA